MLKFYPDHVYLRISGARAELGYYEAKVILERVYSRVIHDSFFPHGMLFSPSLPFDVLKERLTFLLRYIKDPVILKDPSLDSLREIIPSLPAYFSLPDGSSFRVTVKTFANAFISIDTTKYASQIGQMIREYAFSQGKNLHVSLRHPEYTVHVEIFPDYVVYGIGEKGRKLSSYEKYGPKQRIHTHSGSMEAVTARAIVNLSAPKKNDVVLDPFCGLGGLLIEMHELGLQAVGLDYVFTEAVRAQENLEAFGFSYLGVVVGDARKLPFRRITRIASDLPYGKCTITPSGKPHHLVLDFITELQFLARLQKKTIQVAFAFLKPEMDRIQSVFPHQFVLEQFIVSVHKSNQRIFTVLEIPALIRDQ